MLQYKIFRGNINRCTSYKSHNLLESSLCIDEKDLGVDCFGKVEYKDKLFKKDAVLVKFDKGGYIDIEDLNTFFDYIKVCKDIRPNGYKLNGLMMALTPHTEGCLFVDNKLELLYDSRQQSEKQSVHRLIKEFKK